MSCKSNTGRTKHRTAMLKDLYYKPLVKQITQPLYSKRFDSGLFKTTLSQVDWSPVFATSEVNECLARFLHIFNRISNQHALLKSTMVKNCTSKP